MHRTFALLAVGVLFLCTCPDGRAAGPKNVAVKGYTRKDGTYVAPHYRSAPRTSARIEAPLIAPPSQIQQPSQPIPEPRTSARTMPGGIAPVPPVNFSPSQSSRAALPAAQVVHEDEETSAARRLKYARVFLQDQNYDSARRYLKQIVTEFPSTHAAVEARKLLEEIVAYEYPPSKSYSK